MSVRLNNCYNVRHQLQVPRSARRSKLQSPQVRLLGVGHNPVRLARASVAGDYTTITPRNWIIVIETVRRGTWLATHDNGEEAPGVQVPVVEHAAASSTADRRTVATRPGHAMEHRRSQISLVLQRRQA